MLFTYLEVLNLRSWSLNDRCIVQERLTIEISHWIKRINRKWFTVNRWIKSMWKLFSEDSSLKRSSLLTGSNLNSNRQISGFLLERERERELPSDFFIRSVTGLQSSIRAPSYYLRLSMSIGQCPSFRSSKLKRKFLWPFSKWHLRKEKSFSTLKTFRKSFLVESSY